MPAPRAERKANGDIPPPRLTDFPVTKGTIRVAKGCLGAFELVIDDYALPLPSSRAVLAFGTLVIVFTA